MFNVRYVSPSRRRVQKLSDVRDGWQNLGLGDPSTLWYANDQRPGLVTFVTRFGFPWSKNEQDGGTLSLDTTTWGSGKYTVQWNNAGAAVRLGLRCDAMSPGVVRNPKFLYTVACPVYYQSSFSPQQQEFGYNGVSNVSAYWSFWGAVTPSLIVQVGGVNHILAAWTPANVVNNPSVQRRGLFVQTARVNGSNVDVQIKVRTSAGTYTTTPKTITSNSTSSYLRFAQGYNPTSVTANANSSNIRMGGAVCWKGVSATSAQMDAILDKWETLYPLT